MKKQTKRTISILLTVVMVLSMVAVMPITASAALNSSQINAYKNKLNDIHNNPSKYFGSYYDSIKTIEEMSQFGIADVNEDGTDDLLVKLSGGIMVSQYAEFFTANSNGSLSSLGRKGHYVEFYKNGYLVVLLSHNQGPGNAIWPYTVYQYNKNTKQYSTQPLFSAYCADTERCHVSPGSYSKEKDVDKDGVIYYISTNGSFGNYSNPLTKAQYDSYVNKYIPSKNKINIFWRKLTTSNINTVGVVPKITSVNANNSGVGISWNKVSGVPKYRVYKKVNGSWQKIGDTTGASYTDKSVKGNNTYTYTVRGITSNGSSFVTDYDTKGMSIKYTATPSITKREITSDGIKLTWNKPAGTQKVRLYIKKNGSWSKIGDTVNTSYTYKNVKSGTSYAFTVRTVTTDGKQFTSGYSANGWSQKYVSTPQISSINANNSGVQISYNKPAGADKFRIYRKTGSGSWTKLADTTAVSYTDKTAKAGTTYSYTVRCISSDAKSFTSYYNTSGKSINFTATPSITKREVTSEGIKLTWNKPAGTQKVRLYIKKNGSWSKIGDTVNTSYTYKNVKSGTSYAFTVRTVTTDGKQFTSGYSANGWSQKYVATPQISSLTNTKSGVQIKYNKPAGADKFRIYRKTGSGSWTKLADTTAATYTDKTAKSGTTYSYTVRCISSDAKSFTSYYNTSGKSIKCKK